MYFIGICDDEPQQHEILIGLLKEYQQKQPAFQYKTTQFKNAEMLLVAVTEGATFDVLFLDIYMDDMDGIHGAQQLRKAHYSGQIVFCTTSKNHVFEAFSLEATQYLNKPIARGQFFQTMERVEEIYQHAKENVLTLRMGDKVQKIPVRTFVYGETNGNYQHILLEDGQCWQVRITATQLFEQLSVHQEFVRVGRSYIVNMDYIHNMTPKVMVLTTGTVIYLPRGQYAALKEKYFQFLI